MTQDKPPLISATGHGVTISGQQNVVITGDVGGNVFVTIGGRDVRTEELAYLDGLLENIIGPRNWTTC